MPADKLRVTTEVFRRVYNDQTGDYIEVRPDRDGLDLVEIHDPDGDRRINFPPEIARAVAKAMLMLADDLEASHG
jgi:hypothetical protein